MILRDSILLFTSYSILDLRGLWRPCEEPKHAVDQLRVAFLVAEFVVEEPHGSKHQESPTSVLVLVSGKDRTIGRVADRPCGQDGEGWFLDVQSGAIWVDEIQAALFQLRVIVLLLFIRIRVSATTFACVVSAAHALRQSGEVLTEDAV